MGGRRYLERLGSRMRTMVSRAVINLTDDKQGLQTMQLTILDKEVADVERVQQYGFSSVPLPGAEAIALAVGGRRAHTVVIGTDDRRSRPKDLAPGESMIYSSEDAEAGEHRIYIKNGKEIHMVAGSSSIILTPDGITLKAKAFDMVKV